MAPELRGGYHRELERLEISVAALLGLIPDAVVSATAAVLDADRTAADSVVRWRALVGDLYDDVEGTVASIMARQAPVAGELRFLLSCVRLVPHLGEAVDLAADLVSPATASLEDLPSRVVNLTAQMGATTAAAWTGVATLWDAHDPGTVGVLRSLDDELAETRSTLVAELASGAVGLPVALDLAVVGRNYERLTRQARAAAAVIAGAIVPRHD